MTQLIGMHGATPLPSCWSLEDHQQLLIACSKIQLQRLVLILQSCEVCLRTEHEQTTGIVITAVPQNEVVAPGGDL